MQITVENVSGVKKILRVAVPAADITDEFNGAYEELRKTAKIKGFRPGKVPRQVLERLYAKGISQDIASNLVENAFRKAIQENDLRIVGQPVVTPPTPRAGAACEFEASVEVHPTLPDIDYKGLTLTKRVYTVREEEVQAQLQALRRHLVRHEKIAETRALATGDLAVITHEGFRDGVPFELMPRTEYFTLKIGDNVIHPDLDTALPGMMPGETREVEMTFPDDHANKQLAGQKVTVKVELNEIRYEVQPELDDEFAAKFGNYPNLDALRAEIADNLRQGYERRSTQELHEQIFSALLEKCSFEVPDALTDAELEMIIQDAERNFSYHNMPEEQIDKMRTHLREQYRGTAERQVRRQILLGQIIDQEKMTVTDEEMEQAFAEMAASIQQPVEAIRQHYQLHPDNKAFLAHSILEKRAIRLIIESGALKEVPAELESPTPESGAEA